MDFSFIIPVYNAGKTIERCLNSILAQHYDNYEVILVDDGSTDDSHEICKKFQTVDKRFKVYHQRNGGPSVARNRGLDIAKGEWICFVDSDDAIDECYLEKLQQKIRMEDPEIIFIGYRQVSALGEKVVINLPGIMVSDYYENLVRLSAKDMYGYTWIKCLKRKCIGEIRFDEKLNLFEDEVFTCQVLKGCKKLSFMNDAIYDYYTGANGALTQKTHQDYCVKCNYVFMAWENLIDEYDQATEVLKSKAAIFVDRCRYYGLERSVKLKEFYSDLAETRYFALCTHESRFEKFVLKRNYMMLRIEKVIYNLKVKAARVLGH